MFFQPADFSAELFHFRFRGSLCTRNYFWPRNYIVFLVVRPCKDFLSYLRTINEGKKNKFFLLLFDVVFEKIAFVWRLQTASAGKFRVTLYYRNHLQRKIWRYKYFGKRCRKIDPVEKLNVRNQTPWNHLSVFFSSFSHDKIKQGLLF